MNPNTETNSQPITPAVTKPRSARIARQLAWLSPGLGHMYLGQLVRGLSFAMAVLALILISAVLLLRGYENVAVFIILISITVIIGIYSVWDTILIARKTRPDYRLKDYNKPSAYILMFLAPSLAVAMAVAITIKVEVIAPYKITADLSELGIKKGDFIITSKKSYTSESPRVGDQITFKQGLIDSKNKIARIKAIPGDSLPIHSTLKTVPKDQLLVSYLDLENNLTEELISSYSVTGKIVYRAWPPNRFGSISED